MNERQLFLWSDNRDDGLQEVDKGSSAMSGSVGGEESAGEGKNKIVVTVIIRQTGFFGCQSRFEVDLHPNCNLLKALGKDGIAGKKLAQHVLDWLSAAVQFAIVPLVSGIPTSGSAPSAHSDERGPDNVA